MMILLIGTLFLLEHFCYGVLSEQGLIVGKFNPASITSTTEIPEDSTSSFNVVDLFVWPSDVLITSLASDPKKAVVFAARQSGIYIVHNYSVWQNESQTFSASYNGRYAGIEQIAFDYITNNLYWCDSLHDWIAMKPAYDTKKNIYKVVIRKDLNKPEGLALDPEDGLMFFSDNGHNSRIERASLDGQDRVVIVYRGILRVVSLTVDTDNDKLYWADHDRQTLEGCDYDGSNRRVIRRMNEESPSGLVYHEGMLHVVSFNTMQLYKIDITSDSLLYARKFLSGRPYTINVYDTESTTSFKDPCLSLHCDHICINTRAGPTCVCSDGYELNHDGESCTDKSFIVDGMFIISNASMFAMHKLHFSEGQSNVLHSVQLPTANIETFDVDAKSKTIYFVDSGSRSLKKHDITSLKTKTLTSTSSATVTDLSFDWISNLLGWIEPTLSSIRSYSINAQTSATIYTNLQEPTSLTIDPHNSVLYWISGTSVRTIIQGSWTRDVPKILITAANLHNPSSLQYDVKTNRLYWLDRSTIKSSMTNGRDIKSHIVTKGAMKTIAYKDFFGWINKNEIYFARSISENADIVLNTVQNAKDISVFDSTLQEDRRGTCHIQNGHCGGLCVQEENGRRCECDISLHLQKDQSCDNGYHSILTYLNNEKLTFSVDSDCICFWIAGMLLSNFIVVTDFTHGRILQVDLQTGTLVKIPITTNKSPGLAFDKSTMTLFYCEFPTQSIKYTTLQGENTTYFYKTGFSYADRLAIDYSTGNLYYTAVGPTTSESYIGVVHRSTSLHKTLISNLHKPRDIALYPSKGYLFWTEFGNTREIVRANMDGTSKSYIATTQIGWPNGLTIDFTSNRLYWTDGYHNRIESSDLNGGNRQVLATDSDAHLMSIVIHGQYLYYTAWNRQRITKMNKITGLKVPFMMDYPELGRLDGLDIHSDEIRDVSSSCSNLNGLCSTFCFPTPNGRTCGCQDNVKLQSDQLTCEGVSRCQMLHHSVNFIDCRPYPGLSCNFECKAGYRIASTATATCSTTGIWVPSIDSLCKETLCPMHLDNAVLSPSCSRKIGDLCLFNCMKGFFSTTSSTLVCTSEGKWNVDTETLCLPILCPLSLGNAVLSSSCSRRTGDSCTFSCVDGFIPTTSDRLMCTSEGTWNLDTDTLCTPKLCPETIENGHLAENCERRIGNKCSFTCNEKYISVIDPKIIICTTGGLWSSNTQRLCSPIKCPLDVTNGYVSSTCRGMVGEKCDIFCGGDASMNTAHIICLSSGAWDKDTADICRLHREYEKSLTYGEIGLRVLCVMVLTVVVTTPVACYYLRKDNAKKND